MLQQKPIVLKTTSMKNKAQGVDAYPMSPVQKGIVFRAMAQKEAKTYHSQAVRQINIQGFDRHIFQQAFTSVVENSPTLMAAFDLYGYDEAMQVIYKPLSIRVGYHDLQHTANPVKRINDFLESEYRQPFDFSVPPLWRADLFQIEADYVVFVFQYHQAILGQQSFAYFYNHLLQAYVQTQQHPNGLTTTQQQPVKQAFVQIEAQTDVDALLSYWQHAMNGYKRLDIFDEFSNEESYHNRYDEGITHQIKERAAAMGIPLPALYFGAYLMAMKALTYENDITVGLETSLHPNGFDPKSLYGSFSNALPFRWTINEGHTITDYLMEVAKKVETLQTRSNLDVYALAHAMGETANGQHPFFDTTFGYVVMPEVVQPGIAVGEKYGLASVEASGVSLQVTIHETAGGVQAHFVQRKGFKSGLSLPTLSAFMHQALSLIASSLEQKIDIANLLGLLEKDKLLDRYNHTALSFPAHQSCMDWFEKQVRLNPERMALKTSETTVSFATLEQQANQMAHFIRQTTAKPNAVIAVLMERSIDMTVAILGVLKCGYTYMPIGPGFPEERIHFMLNDCQADAVIVSSGYQYLAHSLPTQKIIDIGQAQDAIAQMPTTTVNTLHDETTPFCIIYTSGSSGKPKGVKIGQTGVMNRLYWMWENYPYGDDELAILKTSIGFVDHIWELFGPLLAGVPALVLSESQTAHLPEFAQQVHLHQATRVVLTPATLRKLLHQRDVSLNLLSSIRIWSCSGDALPNDLAEEFYSVFPDKKLLNIYGATETTADVACYDTSVDFVESKPTVTPQAFFESSIKSEVSGLIENYKRTATDLQSSGKALDLDEYADTSINKPWGKAKYIDFLKNDLLPNVVNVAKPSYVGHMTGPLPEFIKDINALMVELNQNLVKIETSNAASHIERQVVGMVHRLTYQFKNAFYGKHVQNSESCLGLVTNGGSISNIMALNYALNKAFAPQDGFKGIAEEGLKRSMAYFGYKDIVVMGSKMVHYSIGKAMRTMGFGKANYLAFDLDKNDIASSKKALADKIRKLQEEKVLVLALIGVAGATETGLVDPLKALGEVASACGVHYHVDAAFGGVYLFSEKLAYKLEGIAYADSVSMCGHKQMYLPMGASVCLFKSPLFGIFSENTTYYQARKGSFDLGRFTIEGSRSFIALLFHGMFKMFGGRRLGDITAGNFAMAQLFAEKIKADPNFQLIFEPETNILNYRFVPQHLTDAAKNGTLSIENFEYINLLNRQIQKTQFLEGQSFVSYTEIPMSQPAMGLEDGRVTVFRAVMMNPYTEGSNLTSLLAEQVQIARKIIAGDPKLSQERPQKAIKKEKSGILMGTAPIGKPIANTQIYILDKNGQLLPDGVVGEICISGKAMAMGYHNRQGREAKKFVRNPFVQDEAALLYKTGDMGRWLPNGNLAFTGRRDNQVKLQGHRIELEEIEHVLRQHFDVEQCVVNALAENEQLHLTAYLVLDNPVTEDALKDYLSTKLPEYMIPNQWVTVSHIPMGPTGKVDRQALPQTAPKAIQTPAYTAPGNAIEQELVKIWERLLGQDKIGVDDNFFYIGGYSLLASRVAVAIEQTFEVEIPLIELLSMPTIAQLALFIKKVKSEPASV